MSQEVGDSKGYSKEVLEMLARSNVTIGDTITILTCDDEISGILMPRYESADKHHLVVKLNSGYNVGIEVSKVKSISKAIGPSYQKPPFKTYDVAAEIAKNNLDSKLEEIQQSSVEKAKLTLPKIALISTGGTIASKIDYRTGGVKSALSAAELYESVPELAGYAIIEPEVLLNEYSENLNPKHWGIIARKILEKLRTKKYRGIIISHGTDTMHYTASALSFALQNIPIPIVLVGAQRSSDRPSSDAALNLISAALFVLKSDLCGVYVAMHATTSDDIIACHIGTRVRKNHTSRRDAFESIDTDPVAMIDGESVTIQPNWSHRMDIQKTLKSDNKDSAFMIKPDFDPRAALLKFYPGFDPGLISHIVASGYRAIVFEGTGLGHVSRDCFEEIKKALDAGLMISMTSQCIWGRTGMTVYDSGRDLLQMGVTPLSDILPETAIVKAMWVLANSTSLESAKKLMQTNIAHEISPVSPIV
ncbi:MAG TPA: Glu-tRNA(Gln) amidotransferase subunit GatD [Nitrososphaeraceae archaeon]|nr:Glu-tRNA(Gln) amidotransferase subunit GatD [Nitrososphaeraceae archaeon]